MNIRNIVSHTGSVTLEAETNIRDAVDLFDPTDPDSAATSGNGRADVLAAESVHLTSRLGRIGEVGNELDVNSRRGGNAGSVSTSSSDNTFLIETSGDLYLNTVEVTSGGTETAYITATVGAIVNAAATSVANIRGGRAYLVAANDIGASGNEILSEIDTLQTKSVSGSTFVKNLGALNLEQFQGTGFAQEFGGSIYTVATSPVTITTSSSADEEIVIHATEDPAQDADNLLIKSGVTLKVTLATSTCLLVMTSPSKQGQPSPPTPTLKSARPMRMRQATTARVSPSTAIYLPDKTCS